jgi:hypothetical protein
MKVKLLSALILFTFSFSHKQLKAKWYLIIMQSLKSKSLMQYKTLAVSDANGEFSIIAKRMTY